MASSRHFFLLLAAFCLDICYAGPLPNVTMVDLGLKEGSCALGDVVYMPGDEFPGTSPCERCSCSNGGVQCAKQRCEPRPGCKAVHRPDQCCPTYQCECEQEGRIYGNGEKLVDPQDPCRVCYCQGGEVVCRRIACFVRDDCQPKLVPGRCCPEYDNCPVRDGTPLPGVSSSILSASSSSDIKTSAPPLPPRESVKPEITIKEITPVSEIPVITDVKIKEILPSPSIEAAEYLSSKAPPIPREATSENPSSDAKSQIDSSEVKEVSSQAAAPEQSTSVEVSSINKNDATSSKINLYTQDSFDDIAASKIPHIIPMMGPSISDISHLTTKAANVIDEEDMDHNPAFPPIPDDLFLVLSNHEEGMSEHAYNEHVPIDHEIKLSSVPISTQEPIFKESRVTTINYISDIVSVTKDNIPDTSAESSTYRDTTLSTQLPLAKEKSMLNMRSVIPTEILNAPSLISDDVTGDVLDITEGPVTTILNNGPSLTEVNTETDSIKDEFTETQDNIVYTSDPSPNDTLADNVVPTEIVQLVNVIDETTNTASKSTEILSETEFSSVPIETSDQNPHEVSEPDRDIKMTEYSPNPLNVAATKLSSNDDEVITLSRALLTEFEQSSENGETTEFLPAFGSQESTTDSVELLKVATNVSKSSALIEPPHRNNNVLIDLINLVGDVASISDHTDGSELGHQAPSATTISDSEELIPVNVAAGYKSKNKNWNLNSITEVPLKNKQNKQKIIEIEGDDNDSITDLPSPNDKVEPTTRLPIIDNVSDTNNNKEVTGKKDIEIITQSYVPTINRRPTKVVMKDEEKPTEGDVTSGTELSTENPQ